MNTQLEILLAKSDLDIKDKFEIRQIFEMLSTEKKVNIINNWDYIILSLDKVKKDLIEEQKILMWKALDDIENVIISTRKTWLKKWISEEIWKLRKSFKV